MRQDDKGVESQRLIQQGFAITCDRVRWRNRPPAPPVVEKAFVRKYGGLFLCAIRLRDLVHSTDLQTASMRCPSGSIRKAA